MEQTLHLGLHRHVGRRVLLSILADSPIGYRNGNTQKPVKGQR